MGLLDSLFSNKSVMNVALGQIASHMEKDGMTAIVIKRDPSAEGETPGLRIRSYKGELAIISGEDLAEFMRTRAELHRLKNSQPCEHEREVDDGL